MKDIEKNKMRRYKVDYAIDLGTTTSAIARIDYGNIRIIRSEDNKDVIPSCVYFNRKKTIAVGDRALNLLDSEIKKAVKSWKEDYNAYTEFKRTMGYDTKYKSSNMKRSYSSEELSAEVLKKLRALVTDEEVNAVIITVPNRFGINQQDATKRAADLAGFTYSDLLLEPIAASIAYGLDTKKKDGYWVVFDFGGGTFDAALVKVDEGVMRIIDTEGDPFLGGKNLDEEIVEKILLPYLSDNYIIDSILEDKNKRKIFSAALKRFAEELKIQMSFNEEYNLLTNLGDVPGEDDEGEEFEIDITVTQEELEEVLVPIFQRAIDQTKELLQRNNMPGEELDALILVGGPTYSPILRKMLKEQICKPDVSIDPVTAVVRGAAKYAANIDIPEEGWGEIGCKQEIQTDVIYLDIQYDSSTVDTEPPVTIKIKEKNLFKEDDNYFVEIERGDGFWSSGKIQLSKNGEVVEVLLEEDKLNVFIVNLYDERGNRIECEPQRFSIQQGGISAEGAAVLPWSICIEAKHVFRERSELLSIPGLRKNTKLPASGEIHKRLSTQQPIRPGNKEDILKIPIYLGDTDSISSRAIYNEHVYNFEITGENLPSLLPEDSEVEVSIKTTSTGSPDTVKAYFPYIDHTVEGIVQKEETQKLPNLIDLVIWLKQADSDIRKIRDDEILTDEAEIDKLEKEVGYLRERLETADSDDRKFEVRASLRKVLRRIDGVLESERYVEGTMRKAFEKLDAANKEFGDEKSTQRVNRLRAAMTEAVSKQNVKMMKDIIGDIDGLYWDLTRLHHLIGFIQYYHYHFDSIEWKDEGAARKLVYEGLKVISEKPSVDKLIPIFRDLFSLEDNTDRNNEHLTDEQVKYLLKFK